MKKILFILGAWAIIDGVNLAWMARKIKKYAKEKKKVEFITVFGTFAETTPSGGILWFPSEAKSLSNAIEWTFGKAH